jgi:hypothetical protein
MDYLLIDEHFSFHFGTTFKFTLRLELEFERGYDTKNDQALLNMMTRHYQRVITVV